MREKKFNSLFKLQNNITSKASNDTEQAMLQYSFIREQGGRWLCKFGWIFINGDLKGRPVKLLHFGIHTPPGMFSL